MARLLAPVIPQTITVHLGTPDSNAQNVTVPFAEYVKNVASGEIYPTWPQEALKANIHAITTFALNRIYTEYYRSRGYDFDITASTQFDQTYMPNREIFENIGYITDGIFNDYVVRNGSVSPFFTAFCNGTTSQCEGLSQWGTVELAENGMDALSILRYYYGDDITLVEDAPVGFTDERYPKMPLKLGERGNNVQLIQTQLNRISENYPAIPKIETVNGIFGTDTENAVRKFQEIFGIEPTGQVDKATWYAIKRYYTAVKRLSELSAEAVTVSEATVPFSDTLSQTDSGVPVRTLQYYLSVIAYFNGALPSVAITGIFDSDTVNAVIKFQQFYAIEPTGIVDDETWFAIRDVYRKTVGALPEGYQGKYAKLYPGYFLTKGMNNSSVADLQTYINGISKVISEIPALTVTGYFGDLTENSVREFQRLFGLEQTGAVGPVTWGLIAREYDALQNAKGLN